MDPYERMVKTAFVFAVFLCLLECVVTLENITYKNQRSSIFSPFFQRIHMLSFIALLSFSGCDNEEPGPSKSTDTAITAEPSAEPSVESSLDLDPEPLDLVAGVQEYTLTQVIDGELVERLVFVHTPPLFDADANYPVLFAFHGNGSNEPEPVAEFNIPQYGSLVDSGAFIGVYPQGHLNSWNLGQEQSTADDSAFVHHIVEQLKISAGVNAARIFATGFSNGAGLTQNLGVHSDLFHAIAPIATALVVGQEPNADTPIRSVLQVHGTADDVCPYEGGSDNPTGHDFYSSEQSISLWAEHNGCDETPSSTTTPDGNTLISYSSCSNGVEVALLSVIDATHGIPPDTEGNLNQYVWSFLNTQ